jgi:hypothetical protein
MIEFRCSLQGLTRGCGVLIIDDQVSPATPWRSPHMPHHQLAARIFAALAPFAFSACSEQSPLGADDVESPAVLARGAAEGTLYQMDARPAGLGAVLDAYVLDAAGEPATDGSAVFYYCSLQGNPAPSTACVTGSGRWRRYGSVRFFLRDATDSHLGHASLVYDAAPSSGTTIGFRFRYTRGTTIASQYSNTDDQSW